MYLLYYTLVIFFIFHITLYFYYKFILPSRIFICKAFSTNCRFLCKFVFLRIRFKKENNFDKQLLYQNIKYRKKASYFDCDVLLFFSYCVYLAQFFTNAQKNLLIVQPTLSEITLKIRNVFRDSYSSCREWKRERVGSSSRVTSSLSESEIVDCDFNVRPIDKSYVPYLSITFPP